MLSSGKRISFGDFLFDVGENVYEPAEDSFLFAENLKVMSDDVVLDMGAGCGILGIIVAEKAAEVVAVDINPYAMKCARANAQLNNVERKMFFVQGDLFSLFKTGELFSLMLFNAPYLPSRHTETDSWLSRAWDGGSNGRRVIDRFILEASSYLKANGQILLLQSTLSNAEKTLQKFKKQGFRTNIVAERVLPFFETILVIEAKRH
jgi:release factor glutamine methyltransferase